MNPDYQIKLTPGKAEIAAGTLTHRQLVVQWTIDIPDPKSPPIGRLLAVEEVSGVGIINLASWKLIANSPTDSNPQLTPISIPVGAKLIVETAGYSVARLSFYPYRVSDPSLTGLQDPMPVNYAPYIPPTANNEAITAKNASTTAVPVAANPNRLGGYIENKADKTMYVKWGDPALANVLTAADPFTAVPAGSNISIDAGYTGIIGLIWVSGVNTSKFAYVHELTT